MSSGFAVLQTTDRAEKNPLHAKCFESVDVGAKFGSEGESDVGTMASERPRAPAERSDTYGGRISNGVLQSSLRGGRLRHVVRRCHRDPNLNAHISRPPAPSPRPQVPISAVSSLRCPAGVTGSCLKRTGCSSRPADNCCFAAMVSRDRSSPYPHLRQMRRRRDQIRDERRVLAA